jgi:hypothetical protein
MCLLVNPMRTKTKATTPESATDKFSVYETLAAFNHGIAQILQNLHRLGKLGFLRREFFTGLQATIEETRAWANFEVVEMLHGREESDWTRFGRLRRQWEKKYEDPNDLLLEAARLKKQRRKSSRGRRRSGP